MSKLKHITAHCYASGEIVFSTRPLKGTIAILTGPERNLREVIEAVARHGYPSKPGAGDGKLLVPGIPEAANSDAALKALFEFRKQVSARMRPFVGQTVTFPHGPHIYRMRVTSLTPNGEIKSLTLETKKPQ